MGGNVNNQPLYVDPVYSMIIIIYDISLGVICVICEPKYEQLGRHMTGKGRSYSTLNTCDDVGM